MVQLEDVTQNVALCENNSLLSAEETQDRKPAAPHTHTTHPLCTSTTLRSNRCSSFILNHRRQGKPGELQAASAVRSQPVGSLRKDKPSSFAQETCCLLCTALSTTWPLGLLTLREMTLKQVQQYLNQTVLYIYTS